MAIDAYALTTLAKAKQFLGRSDFQNREVGVDVYCDALDATSSTVQVTDTTMVLTIVGGLSAAVTTLTFTDVDSDTLSEIMIKVNGTAGWTANLAGYGAENSSNLIVMPATSCLLEANSLALMYTPDELITEFVNRASDIIENVCDRKFMARDFSERYDGDGTDVLILRNYPVNNITRMTIGQLSVMSVRNTSTDAMYATVLVTSTGMTLTIVGGANAGADTETFAANATIGTMVTAINALGKGWVAQSSSTIYDGYPSDELIENGAQSSLLSWGNHQVSADPVSGYRINNSNGMVSMPSGISCGWQNVFVVYNAGYATVPDDLEQACLGLVAHLYGLAGEDTGLAEVESDNWKYKRQEYVDGIPKSVQQTVYRYKGWSNSG